MSRGDACSRREYHRQQASTSRSELLLKYLLIYWHQLACCTWHAMCVFFFSETQRDGEAQDHWEKRQLSSQSFELDKYIEKKKTSAEIVLSMM